MMGDKLRKRQSKLKRFEKTRKVILKYLDKTEWAWNRNISLLLDQVDSKLFGMHQEIHERR